MYLLVMVRIIINWQVFPSSQCIFITPAFTKFIWCYSGPCDLVNGKALHWRDQQFGIQTNAADAFCPFIRDFNPLPYYLEYTQKKVYAKRIFRELTHAACIFQMQAQDNMGSETTVVTFSINLKIIQLLGVPLVGISFIELGSPV